MVKRVQKNINFKENFRQFLKFTKGFKIIIFFAILFALIIEGARIFDKFLFKIVVDKSTEFIASTITQSALIQVLILVAIAYFISLSLKFFGHLIQIKLINKLDGGMIYDLKNKFFNHIIQLSHNFHSTHKTGSLISRMNRGSRAIEVVNDFILFNIIPLILQVVIVGFAIFYFDPISALVLIGTTISFVGFGLYMSHLQKFKQYQANKAEDREKGTMADIFTNIDSIKHFGKEKQIRDLYSKLSTETKEKQITFWDFGAFFRIGQTLILGIGTFLLIYFPLIKLINGQLEIGTVVFIYTSFLGVMGPLYGFVHGIRRFFVALGDFDELFEYGKIQNEIKDKPLAKKLRVKKGKIEFKDINFSYHKKKVLEDINLSINPGEKVALVGHSGSGKTTLIKLLYRLYDTSGTIEIDGHNIKNVKQESLRSELSIVPQECILFDDTIFNNIKFSRPNATIEEVNNAIKFAQLDNFIQNLPDKDKTYVGERGVRLSGGEKQRVSIARAILANKRILVLDEATSSLDSHTEFEIQKDLELLMKNRTSIIIAHRLSTIMNADKIVVMDKGKIVQMGRHSQLIKRTGQYRKLWNLQKGGYIK